MAVGLKLGSITDEIGTSDFFHSFFLTIAGNLEPKGWGTKFPVIMNKFYSGELQQFDAGTALSELNKISEELSLISPDKVIWDIDNGKKEPPWGNKIATTITNLSNYFITSTGRDLISNIREVMEDLKENGGKIEIVKC